MKIVKQWVKEGNRSKLSWNRVPDNLVSYWRQFKNLELEEGLLKRKWLYAEGNMKQKLIVIPDSCLKSIFKLFHGDMCHPGAYLATKNVIVIIMLTILLLSSHEAGND